MPIYEYKCPDCGHVFDVMQKFSDDPVTVCPKCAGQQVKKLISATAFVLKGSGWYKDHYGLKGGDGGSAAKGEGAAKGDGAAKADAAPAPATPSTSSTPSTGGSSGGAAASS